MHREEPRYFGNKGKFSFQISMRAQTQRRNLYANLTNLIADQENITRFYNEKFRAAIINIYKILKSFFMIWLNTSQGELILNGRYN